MRWLYIPWELFTGLQLFYWSQAETKIVRYTFSTSIVYILGIQTNYKPFGAMSSYHVPQLVGTTHWSCSKLWIRPGNGNRWHLATHTNHWRFREKTNYYYYMCACSSLGNCLNCRHVFPKYDEVTCVIRHPSPPRPCSHALPSTSARDSSKPSLDPCPSEGLARCVDRPLLGHTHTHTHTHLLQPATCWNQFLPWGGTQQIPIEDWNPQQEPTWIIHMCQHV